MFIHNLTPPCSLDMRGASRGAAALGITTMPNWAFGCENSGKAALSKVTAGTLAKVRPTPFARLDDPSHMHIAIRDKPQTYLVRKEKTDPTPFASVPSSSRPGALLRS